MMVDPDAHSHADAPVLSLVVPIYNEASILREALPTILDHLGPWRERAELICVDDGSSDESATIVDELSRKDPAIRLVRFSRNFGKEAAMAAGLEVARGEAVVLMDADLQHPPALILDMIEKWREGYHVVNATKANRGRESLIYRAFARIFNSLVSRASGAPMHGASDFKLLDRQVVDAILALPERNRFFRGLVAWVGFRTVDIPFTVGDRIGGESKWSVGGLVAYSLRNLLAFTALPLRLIAISGVMTLIAVFALSAHTLYMVLTGNAAQGFPTVILVQLFLGGIIQTSLGVLALYVAELYDEQKQRPMFIVQKASPESPASAQDEA